MKLTEDMISQDEDYTLYLSILVDSEDPKIHEQVKQQILENQDIVERVHQFKTKYDKLVQIVDYYPKMMSMHTHWMGVLEVLHKILTPNEDNHE